MVKNLISGLILVQILAPKSFLWILPVLDVTHYASYHCMQFQGKQMNQTLENGKKPSFGSILAHLNQILAAKICFQKSGFFSH